MALLGFPRYATLAAAVCLVLTGCGGAAHSDDTAPADEPAAVEAEQTADQAADDQAASDQDDTPQDATDTSDGKSTDQDAPTDEQPSSTDSKDADGESAADAAAADAAQAAASAEELRAALNITEDYRDSFVHGEKGAQYQRYIVLHDTESESDASGVISWWDESGRGVAAHFVVNKDGSVWQCVPLDKIGHHAGYGDTGHNELYGIVEDGRDDMAGSTPIGDWASDYGMNAWSVGIEMVHVSEGGEGYPEAQLEALDKLIAYIDAYYGFESTIIDHKAWRSGNSDTSAEFAEYLANYQDHRTHD